MKSTRTMVMAMAIAVAFCTAMVVTAGDAAPAKAEGKGCATCPGCPKDKAAGDKKMTMGDRMMKRFEAAKPALTDDQKTKIKDLVAAADKKIAAAADGKAKRTIMMELHKSAKAVLTADQIASLPKPPEGKRHCGEGKAGETTPAADTAK